MQGPVAVRICYFDMFVIWSSMLKFHGRHAALFVWSLGGAEGASEPADKVSSDLG